MPARHPSARPVHQPQRAAAQRTKCATVARSSAEKCSAAVASEATSIKKQTPAPVREFFLFALTVDFFELGNMLFVGSGAVELAFAVMKVKHTVSLTRI